MAKVIFVRHGQASFGAQDYDRLSDTGKRQAALTRSVLPAGARVVCGTMRRHQQTAHRATPDAPPELDPDWNEFDYLDVIRAHRPDLGTQAVLIGSMHREADPKRAFQTLYAQAMDRWACGDHDHDYAESRPAFCARVARAFRRLSETSDRPTVVVTSGGPIAVVTQSILSLSEPITRQIEFTLANASLTTFSVSSRASRLISLNSFTHLEAPHHDLVTYR